MQSSSWAFVRKKDVSRTSCVPPCSFLSGDFLTDLSSTRSLSVDYGNAMITSSCVRRRVGDEEEFDQSNPTHLSPCRLSSGLGCGVLMVVFSLLHYCNRSRFHSSSLSISSILLTLRFYKAALCSLPWVWVYYYSGQGQYGTTAGAVT